MELTLKIIGENGQIKLGKNDYEDFLTPMQKTSNDLVYLATQLLNFQNGDKIILETEKEVQYIWVKFDETLNESLIYIKGREWIYEPALTTNGKESISDIAFSGKHHYIQARAAKDFEIEAYRNLALNPHAQKDFHGAYPYAYANVETRDDSTFFARNAIDGIYANQSHGSYPFQSWGINQQSDAALSIEFGRKVRLDRIGFTLRSDFPHDSFWTSITVEFSGGENLKFSTIKSQAPQYFDFAAIETEKIVIKNLVKNVDESPFPALTEVEAFGINVQEKDD